MTSSNAKWLPERPAENEHVPVEEQARRQGVRPLASADELIVPGMVLPLGAAPCATAPPIATRYGSEGWQRQAERKQRDGPETASGALAKVG
jgi:hypothetical protein